MSQMQYRQSRTYELLNRFNTIFNTCYDKEPCSTLLYINYLKMNPVRHVYHLSNTYTNNEKVNSCFV